MSILSRVLMYRILKKIKLFEYGPSIKFKNDGLRKFIKCSFFLFNQMRKSHTQVFTLKYSFIIDMTDLSQLELVS
jgi:hypothetical protein